MKLLAIETATEACSAALLHDGEILLRYEIKPRGHSELILAMMDDLLAEAGTALGQLDALAYGRAARSRAVHQSDCSHGQLSGKNKSNNWLFIEVNIFDACICFRLLAECQVFQYI